MRLELEVKHLRALLAVADEGGVARAAKSLGVSQSTVSEHLLALERALGISATVRKPGQGVELTDAARALLPHAQRVVSAVARTLASVEGSARQLRIGAAESLGSFYLPAALSELKASWPALEVQVSNGLCEDLREAVRTGALDIAITLTTGSPSHQDDLNILRLGWARLALLSRKDDPLGGRSQVTRDQLKGRTVLAPDPSGQFHRCLELYFAAAADIRLQSAGTIDGVKNGILVGRNVGVLPYYTAKADVEQGSLREISLETPIPDMAIEAVLAGEVEPGTPAADLMAVLAIEVSLPAHSAV